MSLNINDDVIDIRDIIERYEELESEQLALFNEQQQMESETTSEEFEEITEPTPHFIEWLKQGVHMDEEREELLMLYDFLESVKGYGGDEQWRGDWYPLTFIKEDHFQAYAEELANELDLIPRDAKWPANCIDWEQAAKELKVDYSETEIDGMTVYYR